jgi:peptide deformylase
MPNSNAFSPCSASALIDFIRMILPIVKYGSPVLRQRGAQIEKVTPEITQLIADMFETMRENHGVGLAAQQIGRALQLTVIDVTGIEDRPSWAEVDGERIEVEKLMPLVLINPHVKAVGEPAKGSEGCLSFPEIFGEITRPESVDVKAQDAKGKPFEFRCGGLLARAVQHETDHLNGILFIDRMEKKAKAELQDELDELQAETKEELKKAK